MRVRDLPPKTLVVIDGNNMSYSSKRFDVNDPRLRHTYLLSMLRHLTRVVSLVSSAHGFGPAQIIVTWDSGLAAWRKKLFPGYKAKRAEDRANEDTDAQKTRALRNADIGILRNGVLPWLGIDQMYCHGCAEGDDLIYHIVKRTPEVNGYPACLILSSDQDLDQLLTPREAGTKPSVDVSRATFHELAIRLGDTEVCDGYTVANNRRVFPNDFVFVKAICGDSSDNIPGVGGCSDGTMDKAMAEFKGDIAAFLNAGPDHPKMPTRARACFTEAGLATIARNVELMSLREPEGCIEFLPGARHKNFMVATEAIALVEAMLTSKEIGVPPELLREIPLSDFVSWVR